MLFFGPYVWLPAGHYEFKLDGEITGEIVLNLTADEGRHRDRQRSRVEFRRPDRHRLAEPVDGFEIVGHRTPSLERLVLRGAVIEYRSPYPALADAPSLSHLAAVSDPTPAAETREARRPRWRRTAGTTTAAAGFPVRHSRLRHACPRRLWRRAGEPDRSDAAIAFRRRSTMTSRKPICFSDRICIWSRAVTRFALAASCRARLRIRMTQNFASDTPPRHGRQELPAAHSPEADACGGEIRDPRRSNSDTRTLTLRAITIVREGDVGEDAPVDAPVAVEEEKAIAAPAGVGDPK